MLLKVLNAADEIASPQKTIWREETLIDFKHLKDLKAFYISTDSEYRSRFPGISTLDHLKKTDYCEFEKVVTGEIKNPNNLLVKTKLPFQGDSDILAEDTIISGIPCKAGTKIVLKELTEQEELNGLPRSAKEIIKNKKYLSFATLSQRTNNYGHFQLTAPAGTEITFSPEGIPLEINAPKPILLKVNGEEYFGTEFVIEEDQNSDYDTYLITKCLLAIDTEIHSVEKSTEGLPLVFMKGTYYTLDLSLYAVSGTVGQTAKIQHGLILNRGDVVTELGYNYISYVPSQEIVSEFKDAEDKNIVFQKNTPVIIGERSDEEICTLGRKSTLYFNDLLLNIPAGTALKVNFDNKVSLYAFSITPTKNVDLGLKDVQGRPIVFAKGTEIAGDSWSKIISGTLSKKGTFQSKGKLLTLPAGTKVSIDTSNAYGLVESYAEPK